MNGSIRKRGKGTYELTIDLGRDANGERRRKFVNVKGTKAQAQRQLRDILASLDKGLPVDTGKITVGEFLNRWLKDYAIPNTRPRTAERYESDIRLHIAPAISHIQLSRLAPSDIQTMEARLLERGKSASSVQHVHAVLREALKHAMRWGLTHRNVAEGVDPPKPHRPEIQPPSAEGVWEILGLAEKTPYSAVLQFMAFTGCRRGEALGLRWSDVDLENGTAAIVQSLQRVKGCNSKPLDRPRAADQLHWTPARSTCSETTGVAGCSFRSSWMVSIRIMVWCFRGRWVGRLTHRY